MAGGAVVVVVGPLRRPVTVPSSPPLPEVGCVVVVAVGAGAGWVVTVVTAGAGAVGVTVVLGWVVTGLKGLDAVDVPLGEVGAP